MGVDTISCGTGKRDSRIGNPGLIWARKSIAKIPKDMDDPLYLCPVRKCN